MIYLQGITISHKQELIKSSDLCIENGKITAVCGESGTGKTSILYLVALLEKRQFSKYSFEGVLLNELNDSELGDIQRNKIGYVFQENNLFEKTTIRENFKLINELTNKRLDINDFYDLLQQVKLDKDLDTQICQLSGGQKQRLAIALALIKKPDLIILDEPTSFLDEENAHLIMKILKDIAVKGNKMILIATHSDIVKSNSDVVYYIENKHLVSKTTASEAKIKLNKTEKPSTISWAFYLSYAYYSLKKNLLFIIILALFSGITISLTMISKDFANGFMNYQINYFDEQLNKEIIVSTNQANNEEVVYNKLNQNIDQNTLDSINNILSVEAIVPLTIWNINYLLMDETIIDYAASVIPLSKYSAFLEYVSEYDENKQGIYITENLYNELLDKDKLTVKLENTEFEFSILGTYNENYKNPYVHNNKNCIYIIDDRFLEQQSSTYLVYTKSVRSIADTMSEIREINASLGIECKYSENEMINDNLNKLGSISSFFLIILFAIVFLLNIVIFLKLMDSRKYEFCILRANGMNKMGIFKIIVIEIIGYSIIIFILCLILLLLENLMIENWLGININTMSFYYFYQFLFYYFILFIIPNMGMLPIILTRTPAKLLRQ